jgi:hypothetical protein
LQNGFEIFKQQANAMGFQFISWQKFPQGVSKFIFEMFKNILAAMLLALPDIFQHCTPVDKSYIDMQGQRP